MRFDCVNPRKGIFRVVDRIPLENVACVVGREVNRIRVDVVHIFFLMKRLRDNWQVNVNWYGSTNRYNAEEFRRVIL